MNTKSVVAGGIFLIGLGVLIFAACSLPPIHNPLTNEKVSFTVDTKEIDGILTHPAAQAPYPAIVLLQGADRGSAQNPLYTTHADNLVRAGFAVLRYDGPGWGGGASNDAGFETLEYRTQEAIAAVKYLQSRPDINSSGVGLWGVSQGGWVSLMAAATYDGVAFIIPVSGSGVTPAETEVYRVDAMSRAAGFNDDEIAKAVLMRRLMVDLVLDEPMYQQINQAESNRLGDGPWREMTELVYSTQPKDPAVEFEKVVKILKSIKGERWAKFLGLDQALPIFDNMPPQAWGTVKDQMRAVMIVDPAEYLVRIHVPVLAIFGENDTFVPVEKSIPVYQQYLGEAGNQAFTYKVFPNADHGIRIGGKFADGYFDLMLNWLRNLPMEKADDKQLETWARGVVLEDGHRTALAQVRFSLTAGKGAWVQVIMVEGRKRQIREIGFLLGLPVVRILRT